MTLARRTFLASLGAAASLTLVSPTILAKTAGSKKLLFIIQRGAADGLAQLAPIGDPAFAALRQKFVEEAQQGSKLDSMFTLHPSLPRIASLYRRKEALFVHATASTYRERSHFDGQNILETGGERAYQFKSGWLNRLADQLVKRDAGASALAIGDGLPAALRGDFAAASFRPSNMADPAADFLDRVGRLYGDDPLLASNLQKAVEVSALAGESKAIKKRDYAGLGTLAAKLMRGPQGADIAMIESNGWDLHAQAQFRMGVQLDRMDQIVDAYQIAMGQEWRHTLVIIATEFGRAAAINGTAGTDHGTGGMMYMLGGAVKGGQIISDWPGLRQNNLLDERDLLPTLSQEAIISDSVAAHFGLDPVRTRGNLFPHVTDRLKIPQIIV
jgi:uncharacterized protein (DUF1501 family)